MTSSIDSVTFVRDAIHNPADPRHFMRVVPSTRTIVAKIGNEEIARSERALKVKEVAFDVYDPVIYFPRADVRMERLRRNDKSTHCPLKGDTEYFDVVIDGATIANAAWSYDRTIPIADVIRDHVAFDTRLVQVTESATAP